jgi:hypothetical protein
MTEQEKDTIIAEVISRIEPSAVGPDFRTGDLARLIGMNPVQLSSIREKVHGFYRVGRCCRFRRAEILYRRAMGLDLFKS